MNWVRLISSTSESTEQHCFNKRKGYETKQKIGKNYLDCLSGVDNEHDDLIGLF